MVSVDVKHHVYLLKQQLKGEERRKMRWRANLATYLLLAELDCFRVQSLRLLLALAFIQLGVTAMLLVVRICSDQLSQIPPSF